MAIRFDLTDLRLFLHVAEAANITRGASRANMALASASERIRAMEDALGIPLLERQRRGVRLTPAGSTLAHHARIVTQQLELMRDEMDKYAKGLRGSVRVLANTVATAEFLPIALVPFLSAHPNIDVDLEERPSRDIVRAIAEGRGDIGIVADLVDPAEGLEVLPFAEDRLVLVVPRRHPLSRLREIAFRDSLEYDFVGLPAGSALQQVLSHHAARAGLPMKVRVRLDGFASMAWMVENGIGIAVLPETTARRCERSMAIHVVPLTDGWAPRHFSVCIRDLKSLPTHAQWLVRHLCARHRSANQRAGKLRGPKGAPAPL
jgi:DNA-binding transcriptional LysR family regulator